MQASLDKFQAIAVGKKDTFEMHPAFNVEYVNIASEVFKLLGVYIDFKCQGAKLLNIILA